MLAYKCMLCCLMMVLLEMPLSTISFSHPNVGRFRGEVEKPAVKLGQIRHQSSSQGKVLDWRRLPTDQVKIG